MWNQWPSPQPPSPSAGVTVYFWVKVWLLNSMLFGCYQVGWIWTFKRKIKLYSGYPFLPRKLFTATKPLLSHSFYGLRSDTTWLGPPDPSLVRLHFRVSARALVISRPNLGRRCPGLLRCLWAEEAISLWAARLRASVPCWLSVGGLYKFLAIRVASWGRSQHSGWLPSEPTTVKEEGEQDISAHVLVTNPKVFLPLLLNIERYLYSIKYPPLKCGWPLSQCKCKLGGSPYTWFFNKYILQYCMSPDLVESVDEELQPSN